MSENEKNGETKQKNLKIDNDSKNIFKKGFFKKVWYSITKIEKYAEMATEGIGRALSYLSKLVAILAIIISLWMTVETNNNIQKGIQYIQNNFPEFSYKDGILQVESEEPITIENQELEGKIIVDTKTDSEEVINQYIQMMNDYGSGIIILKNRAILTNMAMSGSISYNYKETFDSVKISEFTKQNVIQYTQSNQMTTLYISVFATLFIYTYVWYFVKAIWYALIISIFGYLAAWILKIKMRYAPIFNMSAYGLTLSIILNMIYIVINMFTNFTMEYFEVMYVAVATIYLIAAIFIIKSEFIKKQAELMKIVEVQATVEQQLEQEKEDEKEQQKENKETGKKESKKEDNKTEEQEKKEKDKNDDNLGEQPEGV